MSGACSEELTESVEGRNAAEPLPLRRREILLDERQYASTGLSLTWTTGTNYGTGNAIDYVEIAPAEADYADGVTIEAGRRVYAQSYTVTELNDLLRGEFRAAAGGPPNKAG